MFDDLARDIARTPVSSGNIMQRTLDILVTTYVIGTLVLSHVAIVWIVFTILEN